MKKNYFDGAKLAFIISFFPFVTGCATLASQKIGVMDEVGIGFESLHTDGEQIFVQYKVNTYPAPPWNFDNGKPVESNSLRWAVAEIGKVNWARGLDWGVGAWAHTELQLLPTTFLLPTAPNMTTIPIASTKDKNTFNREMEGAFLAGRPIFASAFYNSSITLTRPDPVNHETYQFSQLLLPEHVDQPYAQIKRAIALPFALVFDAATLIIQAPIFLFVAIRGQ
ncbi:MAG: hypothetical protein Q7V20_16170 [Aquabacterium sp.]|uniref:hypothetical protein n=1 Tax=Aquabacterium sp. TaxID=1872578 RepID=UPI002717561A|nr:hypothetical protein [Aquabacterium sp.]MDO9004981.1 hypothetical protein [Aquabacterium sp.]